MARIAHRTYSRLQAYRKVEGLAKYGWLARRHYRRSQTGTCTCQEGRLTCQYRQQKSQSVDHRSARKDSVKAKGRLEGTPPAGSVRADLI